MLEEFNGLKVGDKVKVTGTISGFDGYLGTVSGFVPDDTNLPVDVLLEYTDGVADHAVEVPFAVDELEVIE